MGMLKTLDSSILSFVILLFIYFNTRLGKELIRNKLFHALIAANMLLLVIDVLSWVFNGQPGYFSMLCNYLFNLLLYIVEPAAAIIWILYINYQVFQDEKKVRQYLYRLLIPFSANAAASILSLFTGWFFRIDTNNLYHRGSTYYLLHILYSFFLLFYSTYFVVKNRRFIEKRHYYPLLLFVFPPLAGAVIQVFFYGISLTWSGMTLSLLIIYFNIQNYGLNTDYLTGVYNRRQLDSYIKAKIQSGKVFSGILVDINQFKQINDNFGHYIGDEALKASVQIIKQSLHKDDFIARFGGDEFFIILDIDNYQALKRIVGKIKTNVARFNSQTSKQYQLSFCMGYDVYNCSSNMDADGFFRHIDIRMYQNKTNSFRQYAIDCITH